MNLKPWKMILTLIAIAIAAVTHITLGVSAVTAQADAEHADVGAVVLGTLGTVLGLALAGWFIAIVADFVDFVFSD